MEKIEIRNRFNNAVIISGKYESIKDCLEKNSGANLSGADLRGANLIGAYLREANFRGANLIGAYLRGANFRGANLIGAYLRGADLSEAYLSEAYLREADLREANLSGAYLRGADLIGAYLREANFRGANLIGANLSGADLREANLREAYLRGADLIGAYLRGANFRGANLIGANLRGADLREAAYEEPLFLPDLYLLKLMPKKTKLRAWKYIINGKTPYQYFEYEVGKIYSEKDFDDNENNNCGKGLNVATLVWCLRDSKEANEFLECEFAVGDIIAIPFGTDGKFRVKKLKVIRKLSRKAVIKELNTAMNKKEGRVVL